MMHATARFGGPFSFQWPPAAAGFSARKAIASLTNDAICAPNIGK